MLTYEKGIGGQVVQFPASARIFAIAKPSELLQFRSREPTAAPFPLFKSSEWNLVIHKGK